MKEQIFIKKMRGGTKDQEICREVIYSDCYGVSNWKPKRKPKFIVDVGCQIGAFSLLASQIYPECKILSFEMMEDNFKIANENLSDRKNVKCFNGPVVGKNKPVGVFLNKDNTGGHKAIYEGEDSYLGESRFSAYISADQPEHKPKEDFKSFNFLEIFSDNNIDRIDFLKMDCEGSEYEIIPHLIETGLIKKIDNISLEFHGRDQREYFDTVSYLFEIFEDVKISPMGHLGHFKNLCI